MRNNVLLGFGGILAIFSGFLIVTSGYRSQGMLITVLKYAEQKYGSDIPSTLRLVSTFSIDALAIIISLGGVLVIIGGIIVLLHHVLTGRILVGLGGGVGFIGILIAVGIAFFGSGVDGITSHLDYWIGVILASIAGYIVKKGR
ncbi:MAG: hypothetical protein ACYC7D_00905 [Nitrososphaerales archaeon]